MSFNLSHCRTVFQTKVITKTKRLRKSHEFCGGRHCVSYCSWPSVQQKSCLLIGLNCILFCLNNSSQIAKYLQCWCKQALETITGALDMYEVQRSECLQDQTGKRLLMSSTSVSGLRKNFMHSLRWTEFVFTNWW